MVVITDQLTKQVQALLAPLPLEEQLGALVTLLSDTLERTPRGSREPIVAVILLALAEHLPGIGKDKPEIPGRLH